MENVNESAEKNRSQNLRVYQKARRATGLKIGFYYHLAVYISVNLLLLVINLVFTPGLFWFVVPVIFWGIGIVLHGLSVVIFGLGIRGRMIEREMAKETGK
jgi:hypothetical protein